MPIKPLTFCSAPGCSVRVPRGRCPRHARAADRRRGTAHERGYDSRWQQARRAYLTEYPFCVDCGRPASVVDHNQPHRGDPALFWVESNWRARCATCHNRKTATRDGGFGRTARDQGRS